MAAFKRAAFSAGVKELNFVEKEKHGIDFEIAQKIWEDQAGIEIELT